jgi:hypothetical protein
VEKALLFPNWSSFSRQTPSPHVSNSCGFSLKRGGGGGPLEAYRKADLAVCFIFSLLSIKFKGKMNKVNSYILKLITVKCFCLVFTVYLLV